MIHIEHQYNPAADASLLLFISPKTAVNTGWFQAWHCTMGQISLFCVVILQFWQISIKNRNFYHQCHYWGTLCAFYLHASPPKPIYHNCRVWQIKSIRLRQSIFHNDHDLSQLMERQHFTANMSPFWLYWHLCNAYAAIASCKEGTDPLK